MDIDVELTRVTLGMDQLYRRQNQGKGVLDQEGLVPVILTNVTPAPFETWEQADTALVKMELELDGIPDAMRRAYLAEMLDSLRALAVTFRGESLSYAERVRRCLRVSPDPIPPETLQGYHADIERSLRRLGYGGKDLGRELSRWEADRRVPGDAVLKTLKELLLEAKARTASRMFEFPDGMLEPVGVSGVPFAAYCDYPGRELRLNLDYPYTRQALKHLACHEGFPGHYVHLAVREEKTREGSMPLDAALVVTSSASSPLFEGIAENGLDFLAWVEDADDELALAVNRLRSAARVNAAWMIHGEARSEDEASEYLMATCFQTRAWAQSRLAFLTHALRAPFIYAYWCGDTAVAQVWRRVTPARRSEFWHYLYEHMHTPTTLDKFWTEKE